MAVGADEFDLFGPRNQRTHDRTSRSHVRSKQRKRVAMARGEKIADLRKTDTSIEALTDLIV